MTYRYDGDAETRLNALRAHRPIRVNAIDYIEVSPDQLTLRLFFIFPLVDVPGATVLTSEHVHIIGGYDGRQLIQINAVTPTANSIELALQSAGDAAPFTLRLVNPNNPDPNNPFRPPDGYDPILSTIRFSFKVNCPDDEDCDDDVPLDVSIAPAPLIDYLAKDFDSLRRLMQDRLAVLLPDWDERNPADLMNTLVEVMAYSGDHLSYYQDAVATEAYLGTARTRVAVRRHARLLDYAIHEGSNARTWVYLTVDTGVAYIPQGTQFITTVAGLPVAFVQGDESHQLILQHPVRVFETMHNAVMRKQHNQIHFWRWGADDYILPQGATEVTLQDSNNASEQLQLAVGNVLILQEHFSPLSGFSADADSTRRHVVRLTQIISDVDPLGNQPVLIVRWDAADALPFDMPLASIRGDGQMIEVAFAHGNIILADDGMSMDATIRLPANTRRYSLAADNLTQQGLILSATGEALLFDPAQSASAVTAWESAQIRPAITLLENDIHVWQPQRDLLNSNSFAREFTVEMEDDGTAILRFGDGEHGKLPPILTPLEVHYRVGNGEAGNIGADSLRHIALPASNPPTDNDGNPLIVLSDIHAVTNPLEAAGGTDRESIDSVKQYAPYKFKEQARAVTVDDYAEMAQRHSDVQRAVATRRWTGSWSTVFITVDRVGGKPVDTNFVAVLRQHLERFRLSGHDIEIDAPRYVPLDIAPTICVKQGFLRSKVKEAVTDALSTVTLPDGQVGFFYPDRWTFGQPIYLSELTAVLMNIAGVDWVRFDEPRNRFRRLGVQDTTALATGRIDIGRLEIAVLGAYVGMPRLGQLEIFMEGEL